MLRPETAPSALCDVRTVRNVRNFASASSGPLMARFDARAARLVAEARAAQLSTDGGGQEVRTIRTLRTAHDQLDAFFERASILEADAGLSRREAMQAAAREQGCDLPDQLFAAVVAAWVEALELVEAASNHRPDWAAGARGLIDSGMALHALAAFWTPEAIWAVGAQAGLVARLRGCAVVEIDEGVASLSDGRRLLRPVIDAGQAELLWEKALQKAESWDGAEKC